MVIAFYGYSIQNKAFFYYQKGENADVFNLVHLSVVTVIVKRKRFILVEPFLWSLDEPGLCLVCAQGKLSLISGESGPIKRQSR